MLIFFLIGSFFLPGEIFTIYAWIAVLGAGLFILIQLILLLDLAYSWSESWVEKWNNSDALDEGGEDKKWYYGLLAATLIIFSLSLILNVLMYIVFCHDASKCWYNPLMITINLVVCIILVILSVHPKIREFNDRVGLLQASIFTLYCTYYIYSSILSEPNSCSDLPFNFFSSTDDSGNTINYSPIIDWITLIFGAIFTVASVVYASLSVGSIGSGSATTGSSSQRKEKRDPLLINTDGLDEEDAASNDEKIKHEIEEMELEKQEDDEEGDNNWVKYDDEKDQNVYNYSLFHLAFALGAMYVGMLLSNWSVVSSIDMSVSEVYQQGMTGETNYGWVAVGVKLVSVCVAILLYCWSIFAPLILPNRRWDQ